MNRREFISLSACAAAVSGCVGAKGMARRDCADFDMAVDVIDGTTPFDEGKRFEALKVLQREIYAMGKKEPYYDFVNAGPDLSAAEVAAVHEAYPPLKWYDHAFDKVMRELQEATVTDGKPAVWYVYNMGIVVKTAKCAFSIDLCHRKAPLLAPFLDFALSTHHHDDHFTEAFVKAMRKLKKPVRSNFVLDWNNYSREETAEAKYADVLVKCTTADHNRYLPKAVTCFECHIGEGAEKFVIFHSGDCWRAAQLKPSVPHPDLYFGHCAIGLSFKDAWETTMPAKLMVISHHQELGHLGGPWRCVGFHEEPASILKTLHELKAPVVMPVWGDKIQY